MVDTHVAAALLTALPAASTGMSLSMALARLAQSQQVMRLQALPTMTEQESHHPIQEKKPPGHSGYIPLSGIDSGPP